MGAEQHQLEAGIQAFEAQRSLLGDAVVDMAVAPLRARLATLRGLGNAGDEPEPAQSLKQVSILFLDVVGSTTLSQHLDPEAISDVMDNALTRGTAVVEQHRGKVLQYAGDNILAVFGAEEAREDDAERAVRCGLQLLALGCTLGAEVLALHHHAGFNVRVGVHTGGVLLGGGVDAEGSIRGIAVNIAARMEQTAPTGALRISHDTYAQVRGLFEVQVQAPLAVKGVDAPVQSYLVLRAKPRQFRMGSRGIEGVVTKMIGRDDELEALQAAYRRLFIELRLAAVTVVADAGIGKSRLLSEFQAWSETRSERFLLFRGRARPRTGAQAFGLLRDIIYGRFQIAEDDDVATARRKLEEGMVPLFVHDEGPDLAQAQAHLLGYLLGIEWRDSRHICGIVDDPRQIRNRAFHAAAQVFRRASASDGAPVILQIEDLHWADGESLDFLTYLLEVNRDVPLLLLGCTRPTLFERRSDWCGSEGLHQRIDLVPLDKRASRELANELLQKLPEVPAALRELLTSSAEGNPFYMEELLKMLIDQGAIQTGETWTVDAQRLLVTHVPPTLTGVLQARLDSLPAPEKRALQQASVVGAVFWDRALAAIEANAAEQLPTLALRELALPRTDAHPGGLREYTFRHQVLHQVTYDTVLKRHRREGHARVARWLAGLTGQAGLPSGDLPGLAAEHFEQAGDDANAAEFHARAAESAGQRLAHERVLVHVGRALALLDGPAAAETGAVDVAGAAGAAGALPSAQAELRWRLLAVRERTYLLQARREEEAADLDALDRLADSLDDDHRRAEVAWRRGVGAARKGDWAATAVAARRGMACAERAAEDGLRLNALRLLALAQMNQGDVEGGRLLALKGLAEARSLGLRGAEARLLNALVMAAEMQGAVVSGLELSQQNLLIHRDMGDRVNEAIVLANLGAGWLNLGHLPQARLELEAALRLLRANVDRVMEGAALCNLSTLTLWQGDDARALSLARQALDIAEAAQARSMQVAAGLRLASAELALGRWDEARQAFEQARTRARDLDSAWQYDATAGLARVALAEGDVAQALAALQPVLDLVQNLGLNLVQESGTPGASSRASAQLQSAPLEGTNSARLIELTCHQVLLRAGDARAAGWIARAHGALMARAESINDAALRQSFLNNVPYHRDITVAWVNSGLAARSRASHGG